MTLRTYQGITPALGEGAYVDSTALVLGDVEIGEQSSVWPLTVIRGDDNYIRIGDRSNIQDGCVLHITHAGKFNPKGYPLILGNDITVGHSATLHGCTLKDRILVGMGSIVMDNALIQSDVVIGAGSMVTPGKELESGYLYMGRPAKKVRPLTEQEISFFTYSAAHYVGLKNRHMADS